MDKSLLFLLVVVSAYGAVEACKKDPVHCKWSNWSYGQCSKTCGTGTQVNTRYIATHPKDGGSSCSGHSKETKACKIKECPVHCQWNNWLIGDCSVTCGGGTRTNQRTKKVTEKHGGNACSGYSTMVESCNENVGCPVDCEWEDWELGQCSAECGGGLQPKFRGVAKAARYGGKECEGPELLSVACNTQCCPEPCAWGEWQLGTCSATCGVDLELTKGSRIDIRSKSRIESCGGPCNGENERIVDCDTSGCPAIHCEWDEWKIGECSKECGTGTRTNTREKKVVEKDGGTCTGQPTETEECKLKECPVHCEWNDWTIGECSKPCGGGERTKTRDKKVSAEHGGDECEGTASITESCNVQECPVDCKWNAWVAGDCSVTCGDGVLTKTRTKEDEMFGGLSCEGESSIEEKCPFEHCPVDCEWDEWELGTCSVTCGGGRQTKSRKIKQKAMYNGKECEGEALTSVECNTQCCPASCVWEDWQLGECSATCGATLELTKGTRMDKRTKQVEESCGGSCDGLNERNVYCDTSECPAIHCEWDEWVVGKCSEECGTGTRTNTRTKKVEEKDGGTCTGKPEEIEECKIKECPVHCEWDEWQIGECSEECGGGTMTKTRTKKVEAEHEGEECKGKSSITESCNVQECPVNCEWNDWVLGKCSEECGTGTRTNTRTKKVVEAYGGTCTGQDNDVEECKIKECPVHCEWNDWVLGECSEECGAGTRTNTRTKKVVEAYGGTCTGQANEVEECKIKECPVHCEWTAWNVTECDKSCGGGTQIKTREVSLQAKHGGSECSGQSSILVSCNVQECPVCPEEKVPWCATYAHWVPRYCEDIPANDWFLGKDGCLLGTDRYCCQKSCKVRACKVDE